MNEEIGPKDKKPAVKNSPPERPFLINLDHGSKLHGESGSENNNMEEIEREKHMKNTKNMKEIVYTNIGSYKSGEQAEQEKIKKGKNDHEKPRNHEKMEKLLSPRK